MTCPETDKHTACPDCGSPLVEVLTHIPDSLVRRYRCGVRWLDVQDSRRQVALSGSPFPCAYIAQLRRDLDDVLEIARAAETWWEETTYIHDTTAEDVQPIADAVEAYWNARRSLCETEFPTYNHEDNA